jgi:hypothetical protein
MGNEHQRDERDERRETQARRRAELGALLPENFRDVGDADDLQRDDERDARPRAWLARGDAARAESFAACFYVPSFVSQGRGDSTGLLPEASIQPRSPTEQRPSRRKLGLTRRPANAYFLVYARDVVAIFGSGGPRRLGRAREVVLAWVLVAACAGTSTNNDAGDGAGGEEMSGGADPGGNGGAARGGFSGSGESGGSGGNAGNGNAARGGFSGSGESGGSGGNPGDGGDGNMAGSGAVSGGEGGAGGESPCGGFYDGDALIDEQTEVDALRGVTSAESLTISGEGIQSLRPLHCLEEVFSLRIQSTGLRDLEGLEALKSVEILGIIDNQALTNVGALTRFHAEIVSVRSNQALTSVAGLANGAMETLSITDNDALTNLDGLEGLGSAWAVSIDGNLLLGDIMGLRNLSSVNDGSLSIADNAALTNLDGLVGLEEVWDTLSILRNASLVNLSGLAALESVDVLRVQDNPELAACSAEWLRDKLGLTEDRAILSGNAGVCQCDENGVCE